MLYAWTRSRAEPATAAAAKLMILFSSGWEVMRTAGRPGTSKSTSSDGRGAGQGPPRARRVRERLVGAAARWQVVGRRSEVRGMAF